jgi:hypothetical protein
MSDGTVESYTGSKSRPNDRMSKSEAILRAQQIVEEG